ncbi:MAG: hypothetical protein ABIS67_00880 [Candidatus Eisenbacteria bacterium]
MKRLPPLLVLVAMVTATPGYAASPAIPRLLADTAWAACGAPVSIDPRDRVALITLADGDGGVFAVWQDIHPVSLRADLYAHRLGAEGAPAAGWPAGGRALTTDPGGQFDQVAIPDASGGFLIAWADDRADSMGGSNPDIYALRVTAAGTNAAGWNSGGTRLTASRRAQQWPALAPDGAGGGFVAWGQPAAGSPDDGEIVLQRVLGDGTPAPGWPDSGIVIAGGPGARGSPTVVTDEAGGCIVAWDDGRGIDNDIYAQRVTAAGGVLWSANGVLACGGTRQQVTPRGVPDGAGGIVLAIQDLVTGQFTSLDLLAQRLDSGGSPAPGWTTAGVGVCRAPLAQVNHHITTDGAGGAFVGWDDYRTNQSRSFVQHVLGSGLFAPGWDTNGNTASTSPDNKYETHITADGAGGVLVGWTSSALSVAAQRLTANGTPAAGWPSEGVTLCTAFPQFTPSVAVDGAGGVIVTRFDTRAGGFAGIYASRVTTDALVPTRLAPATTEVSPTRVRLRWFGAEPGTVFDLWRRTEGAGDWTLLARPVADGSRFLVYEDADVRPGRFRYRLNDPAGDFTATEVVVEVPATIGLAFEAITPNPSSGAFRVRFASPGAALVRLDVFDLGGRRVVARMGRVAGGSQQRIEVGGVEALASGVYRVRLTVGTWSETRTLCVVR